MIGCRRDPSPARAARDPRLHLRSGRLRVDRRRARVWGRRRAGAPAQPGARAVAGGAAFLTPNLDPRLPVEGDDFLPGCGAIVEAVAAAGCVRPLVVGKPEPPLFELALARMQLEPAEAAMVGDSVDSDIRGARRVGLTAVLLAPKGALDGVAHYMVKSMAQLKRLVETYNP